MSAEKCLRKARLIFVAFWLIYAVLILGSSIAFATTAPSPTPEPTTPPSPTAKSDDQVNRKSDLEIEKLEQDTGTVAQFRAWLPAGTAAVALVALGIGVYQYRNDRRRDQDIRLQEQFTSNLETVAEYARGETKTTARLLAALTALKEVVQLFKTPNDYRRKVTEVIVTEVRDDVEFEDSLQVRFALVCLQNWPDYGSWLQNNPNDLEFLFYRYNQGVAKLAKEHMNAFRMMEFDGNAISPQIENERDFLHFRQLARGYAAHLALSEDKDRSFKIEAFGKAIGNATLANDLLKPAKSPIEDENPIAKSTTGREPPSKH